MSKLDAATKAQLQAQLSYSSETAARLSGVKGRLRGAQHYLRRRDPEHAADKLLHVINEARRLRLHLAAWDSYMPPSNPFKPSL